MLDLVWLLVLSFQARGLYSESCSIAVIQVKIHQAEKTIEILLVRPTEVCGKVYSEKNGLKSVKTSL